MSYIGLCLRGAAQYLHGASGPSECFCDIVQLCACDDNLHLLATERWHLLVDELGFSQASRGKATFRCHCEAPRQAVIKFVHQRNLRKRRVDLKAFILKWQRCHLSGRNHLKADAEMGQRVVHERRERADCEWIVKEVGKSLLWGLILQAFPDRIMGRYRADRIQTMHPVVFRLWAHSGHIPELCQCCAVWSDTHFILNLMCSVTICFIGKCIKHQEWINSIEMNGGVLGQAAPLYLIISSSLMVDIITRLCLAIRSFIKDYKWCGAFSLQHCSFNQWELRGPASPDPLHEL